MRQTAWSAFQWRVRLSVLEPHRPTRILPGDRGPTGSKARLENAGMGERAIEKGGWGRITTWMDLHMTIDEALKAVEAGSADMVRKAVQSQTDVAASIARGRKVDAQFRSHLSVVKAVRTIGGKRANVTVPRLATAAPMDFSHLIPVSRSAEAVEASAPTPATFAEKMMAADAWTRNQRVDFSSATAGPPQRRVVVTGADILAAHRAITGSAQ